MYGVIIVFSSLFSLAVHQYWAVPVSLVFVITLGINLPARSALLSAFIIGILTDIVFGSPMGLHTLFYLISSFILVLYQRRFHTRSYGYILLFSVVLIVLYYQLFYHYLSMATIVSLLIFTLFINRLTAVVSAARYPKLTV